MLEADELQSFLGVDRILRVPDRAELRCDGEESLFWSLYAMPKPRLESYMWSRDPGFMGFVACRIMYWLSWTLPFLFMRIFRINLPPLDINLYFVRALFPRSPNRCGIHRKANIATDINGTRWRIYFCDPTYPGGPYLLVRMTQASPR